MARELYLIRPLRSPHPLSHSSPFPHVSLFCFYGASISVGWLDSRSSGVSPTVRPKTEKKNAQFILQ